eukprot:scaffold30774_cov54-Phaeocystis_antarctica.AAC.3
MRSSVVSSTTLCPIRAMSASTTAEVKPGGAENDAVDPPAPHTSAQVEAKVPEHSVVHEAENKSVKEVASAPPIPSTQHRRVA